MPEHIQKKFAAGEAITEGKGVTGHGLGLTQVRDALIAGKGNYDVAASELGTIITINFPAVATPPWLATVIRLTCDDTVIILDDDNSIHGAWDSTFTTVLATMPTLKIKHYTNGEEVIADINQLSSDVKGNVFLLTDYELLGQGINGLDVVAKTKIQRAILVTSYAANKNRQHDVLQLGIKMLPKELFAAINIVVDKKIPKWSRHVDMVWLEDQQWFIDDIVMKFYGHIVVDKYYTPTSLMEDIHQYPLTTRIVLDTYYGHGYIETGMSLAEKLYNLGYTKLILYTGEECIDLNSIPPYLTIISKFNHDHTGDQALDKVKV